MYQRGCFSLAFAGHAGMQRLDTSRERAGHDMDRTCPPYRRSDRVAVHAWSVEMKGGRGRTESLRSLPRRGPLIPSRRERRPCGQSRRTPYSPGKFYARSERGPLALQRVSPLQGYAYAFARYFRRVRDRADRGWCPRLALFFFATPFPTPRSTRARRVRARRAGMTSPHFLWSGCAGFPCPSNQRYPKRPNYSHSPRRPPSAPDMPVRTSGAPPRGTR